MNTATGVQHCADQWEQRVGAGDWNALHRDLYGDLVFPLQVVITLGLVFHDAA
jgi:hypothetical protein